jgi:hypothetical protein
LSFGRDGVAGKRKGRMKCVLVVLAVMADAPKWFRRGTSLGKIVFAARVSNLLFDLGIDVRTLPALPKAQFFIEASALHSSTKGRFHPKRMAMRFFGWFCAENANFDYSAFMHDGAMIESISIMRSWAAAEPELFKPAEREINLIVTHLFKGFETLDLDKGEQLYAQLQLLNLAAKK